MVDPAEERRHLDVMYPTPPSDLTDLVLEDDGRDPPTENVEPEELRGRLISALRGVYDPEIPVNVYDLGLVYELAVDDAGRVRVEMTLTAPGCPVADQILHEVHSKLRAAAGVSLVQTKLVWDPPWTPDRMSQAVKLQLGLL